MSAGVFVPPPDGIGLTATKKEPQKRITIMFSIHENCVATIQFVSMCNFSSLFIWMNCTCLVPRKCINQIHILQIGRGGHFGRIYAESFMMTETLNFDWAEGKSVKDDI